MEGGGIHAWYQNRFEVAQARIKVWYYVGCG